MTKKDEVLIDDSNLKDFLKQDLEALESFYNTLNNAELDLPPEPIYKNIEKEEKNERKKV